ncbi:hypothetical protein PTI98_005363 [Pleurotus ostreatus]|nr:hypothetical protein PTI98_005363 [Pleurotus ostreatus]
MAPASDTRPSTSLSDHARNSLSISSLQPAALEVCHQMYGEFTHSSSQETLERFYESNAV